jgi:hypothetical protein
MYFDGLLYLQVVGIQDDASPKLAQHRAEVYHAALGIVFADFKSETNHGMIINIFETQKKGLPIFMAVSADYEEM